MIVVADSSALVALATCRNLTLLTSLFDEVRVPPALFREVTVSNKPEAAELEAFLIDRIAPVELEESVISAGGLGQGEIEAMALYRKLEADYLLIDDKRARTVAEANHIQCIGALGLLLLAKERALISEIAPALELLHRSSIYYNKPLLRRILEMAGEAEA